MYYLNHCCDTVEAKDDMGKRIASVTFQCIEGDLRHGIPDSVTIYMAETEASWRRQGIATSCVEYARQEMYSELVFDAPSIADTKKSDGNYLTNDGASFVSKLRSMGWVSRDRAYVDESNI